jgi:hypothetical protein
MIFPSVQASGMGVRMAPLTEDERFSLPGRQHLLVQVKRTPLPLEVGELADMVDFHPFR